ncbi:predicted protein [Uncinocarpus reesii 1704]|uniref:TauD/TfdA-like domain-containing protein n=1 Tax=Uncinocarpus reesii (strain UAMH 1704) TaxID=336963 RepID=C4JHH9_UNCRE|nr:uncharacterized protein UREG_01342 [Uncinocarpus reesii 1704]EEP76493.1 predicted protein [Uncinocarpus reesii 1704]
MSARLGLRRLSKAPSGWCGHAYRVKPSLRAYSSAPIEPEHRAAVQAESNLQPGHSAPFKIRKFPARNKSNATDDAIARHIAKTKPSGYNAQTGEIPKPVVDTSRLWLPIDGVEMPIARLRLRDACTCSKCIDPSTKQRNFATSDLDMEVAEKDVSIQPDKIVVTWSGSNGDPDGSHISEYSMDQLRSLFQPPVPRHKRAGGYRIAWNKESFTRNQHWISFDEYMNDEKKFRGFMRSLYRYGLVFVKDVPESTESVSQIATKMGPLRNSFYGSTWDVRSQPDAKNVAYTNKFLGFHMDLLYMADPPGYQLLHCMSNSLPGGESMFSDTVRAAEQLYRTHRHDYNRLWTTPVRFGYFNDGQRYEYTRPTFEGDRMGDIKLHNGVEVGPTFRSWVKAMRVFANSLEKPENVFKLKLNPGECAIFANRRVVHAREAFDLSGSDNQERSRWLRGAYVDEDALLSKFEICRAQNPEEWREVTEEQWMSRSLTPRAIREKMIGRSQPEPVQDSTVTE